MIKVQANFGTLQKNMNYFFKDTSLLTKALTHSSYVNENGLKANDSNERLEFLGDAVLGLVIGEFYFKKYEDDNEGELSKLRSSTVNEHILSIVANKIRLGEALYFGRGEIKNGGKNRESILADALEAVIGAIFLDSSFETARNVILDLFKDLFRSVECIDRDYKTKLQEVVQKDASTIKYILIDEYGPDNNKTFHSSVLISGKLYGKGMGKTKKKSEQMAAFEALKILGEGNV